MTAPLQFPSHTPMTAPPKPQLNDHVTMQGMDVEHNLFSIFAQVNITNPTR